MICPCCQTDLDVMHDCRDETLKRLAVERDDWKRRAEEAEYAGNLLAVVHGDGGHYLTEHGWRKAADDAMEKYFQIVRERDRLAELLVQFESLARLSLDNFKADIENKSMPHSCGQLIGRLRHVLKEEK